MKNKTRTAPNVQDSNMGKLFYMHANESLEHVFSGG